MTTGAQGSLSAALGLDGGIVCAVGAGGKKSLLYALAREAAGRVGVTSTVMMLTFPPALRAQIVLGDDAALRQALARPGESGLLAYACPCDKRGRLAGVAPATVADIHVRGQFGLTLVKADGARMRGIKAPRPGEPLLPETTAWVLPVVSAAVIGKPLDAGTAHRPERLADAVGAEPSAPLTAEHIGRLLASERGSLQATAGLRVVPVINQVDNDDRLWQARNAAHIALARSDRFDRVVLTCLRRDNPLVEIVFRDPALQRPMESTLPIIRITLPEPLQALAGDAAGLTASGANVGQALADLGSRHLALTRRLLTRSGAVREHVNLFLNDQDIRAAKGLKTPLHDGDVLLVVASVAGG